MLRITILIKMLKLVIQMTILLATMTIIMMVTLASIIMTKMISDGEIYIMAIMTDMNNMQTIMNYEDKLYPNGISNGVTLTIIPEQ